MTPKQARTMLTNIMHEAPEKQQAALNAITFIALDWFDALGKLAGQLNKKADFLAKAMVAMRTGGQMPAEDGGGMEAAPMSSNNSGRVHADGTPYTAEEIATEDMMDRATAGMPPNPNAPMPQPMPAGVTTMAIPQEPHAGRRRGEEGAPEITAPELHAGRRRGETSFQPQPVQVAGSKKNNDVQHPSKS